MEEQLPAIIRELTDAIGAHIDQLVDVKLMVIKRVDPELANRVFLDIGQREPMVAAGLNMIGAQAGCRHRGRVPAYLNNLERLGLIWFSREPVPDLVADQVLEAQPDVLGRSRTPPARRRSSAAST